MKRLILIVSLIALTCPAWSSTYQKRERHHSEKKERAYHAPKERKERAYHAPREKKERASTYQKKERTTTSAGVQRDRRGRIKRSSSATREFKKQTGYPHGRKGYVIDHIKPLKEGGCDCPENMQWQTIEDAKAKDKWE